LHQQTIGGQDTLAIAIKLFRKQDLTRPDGIGAIDNDDIVAVGACILDPFNPVGEM
jgi:hypothetical protein